ncbi:MAG: hypothetical protein HY561_04295 [Gemmatimonadetes bacterium]|nr:hypothetical protein [Gemmatimonadota bacterium]
MSGLGYAAAFGLGVYLSIRTIAALYRIPDLWYTMRNAWPKVLRGIAGWGGATVLMGALLPGYRLAFLWGVAGYLAFYIVVGIVLSRVLLPKLAARPSLDQA